MTGRDPNRSATMPASGAHNPCTTADTDRAPAVRPRDQRNSSTRGTKNTEKEKNRP
jgi:hypothetical protein